MATPHVFTTKAVAGEALVSHQAVGRPAKKHAQPSEAEIQQAWGGENQNGSREGSSRRPPEAMFGRREEVVRHNEGPRGLKGPEANPSRAGMAWRS